MRAFALFIILFLMPAFSLKISEVSPTNKTYLGCEWVELYNENNFTCNFSGYLTDNLSKNETFVNFSLPAFSFLLILEDKCNESLLENVSFIKVDKKITRYGLKNDGECLYLKGKNESFCWNYSLKENKTFCRLPENSSKIIECIPTPGEENRNYFNHLSTKIKIFEILEFPDKVKFGSLNFIKGVLYKRGLEELFGRNISKIRVLIYSPRGQGSYIAREFNEEIIYSKKGCNSKFALELENITNKTFIALPFFITKNCEDKIESKDYLFKIRVFILENNSCPSSSKNYRDIANFSLKIEGKNEEICPTERIIYKSKKCKCESHLSTKKEKEIEIEILNLSVNYPLLNVKVRIKNNLNSKVKGEIYSYVYEGRKCYSGSWKENAKEIEISGKEEKIIELENKLTLPSSGKYNFKVRFYAGNLDKKFDVKKEVYIKVKEESKVEKEKKLKKGKQKANKKKNLISKKEEGNRTALLIKYCENCSLILEKLNNSLLIQFYSKNKKVFEIEESLKNETSKIQNNFGNEENKEKITGNFILTTASRFYERLFSIFSFFESLIREGLSR